MNTLAVRLPRTPRCFTRRFVRRAAADKRTFVLVLWPRTRLEASQVKSIPRFRVVSRWEPTKGPKILYKREDMILEVATQATLSKEIWALSCP